jgi:hypothetical protein
LNEDTKGRGSTKPSFDSSRISPSTPLAHGSNEDFTKRGQQLKTAEKSISWPSYNMGSNSWEMALEETTKLCTRV